MTNPLFHLAYWYQRLIACPIGHGRHKAHAEHVARAQEAQLVELKKKYGENLERMPRTPFMVFGAGGGENTPEAGEPMSFSDNVRPFGKPN